MTIDVEDYFHASALSAAAPFELAIAREPCAAPTPIVCSRSSTKRASRRRSSCWDGWRSDIRRSCGGSRRRSRDCVARLRAPADLLLTPEQFREDVRRAKACSRIRAAWRCRVSRAELFDHAAIAVGARRPDRGRLSYDASIFPIHHDRYGIPVAPRHPYVCARRAAS